MIDDSSKMEVGSLEADDTLLVVIRSVVEGSVVE